MKDSEIVELYWQRNENAIQETKNRYDRYLTQIAYQVLFNKEDADECVSDTYLAAWNSMPDHRPAMLSTYLGKIVRQISIDAWRKRKRQKRQGSEYDLCLDELEDIFQETDTPEKAFDQAEFARTIEVFLHNLPKEARVLFIGRYYLCDPLKEVAAYYGFSESKAKSILHRTRKKLKKYLEKEGYFI